MGLSYKYASSILLCPEDSSSILGFDDGEGEEQDLHGEAQRRDLCQSPDKKSGFCGGILMDFTLQSEDCVVELVERESQHRPQGDYAERLLRGQLDMVARSDAIDWIQKFQQDEAWITQLLSVACLSLAAKVEETEVPLSLELQVGDANHVFEARTIHRMELLVLGTLKWRMQALTPFSFIGYFLYKFSDGNLPDSLLISSSVDLILGTVREIDFLEYRPSEIAAAVALSVLNDTQILDLDQALACCIHVNKERVLKCHRVIQEMTSMKNRTNRNTSPSISAVPKSPIGVLDAACLSDESDDLAVESHGNCLLHSSPAAKKRKLNRPSTS
ncbi:cyclin-D4-1-like isoform X2 [Musa acuminata AAA Group]|uniref:cyclin-D4-1-like isoform X2 n=1 Tax=Musa acuminata AAA Group TaxID=214697 RepID=UPI0031D5CFAD